MPGRYELSNGLQRQTAVTQLCDQCEAIAMRFVVLRLPALLPRLWQQVFGLVVPNSAFADATGPGQFRQRVRDRRAELLVSHTFIQAPSDQS